MLGLVMLACGASVSGAGIQTAIAQTAAVPDSIEVQPTEREDEPKVVPTMTALPTPEPTEETATEPPPLVFVPYRDFEILPAALTVQVGQQMEFLIESAAGQLHQPYTPGFQNPGPNNFEALGNLGDGTTYAFTFQESGTVTLLCGYHANMVAQVDVVQP